MAHKQIDERIEFLQKEIKKLNELKKHKYEECYDFHCIHSRYNRNIATPHNTIQNDVCLFFKDNVGRLVS